MGWSVESPPEAESPRPPPQCPFCRSRNAEVISLFGTQAMTLQYRCAGCGSFYEAIKYDRPDSAAAEPGSDPPEGVRRPAGDA